MYGRRSVLQIFLRVMNGNLIKSKVEVGLFQTKDMNVPSHAYGMESDCISTYIVSIFFRKLLNTRIHPTTDSSVSTRHSRIKY
jgi:hypothetical protein